MATSRKNWTVRTLAAIASDQVDEAKIRAMRRIIRNTLNDRNADTADNDRMHAVAAAVEKHKPRVSAEQSRKGADWLYKQAFTPRGIVRRTEFAQALSEHDLAVIRECLAAPRFQLVELEFCEGRYNYIDAVFPVYRCHGADGKSFDYSARAWQSGGNSFVIDGSRRYGT